MFLFVVLGILYLVFAFHEPPEILANMFRVPVISVFFAPERRVKLGRITMGVLLIALGAGSELWDLCQRLFHVHGVLLHRNGPIGILLAVVILVVIGAARWKRAGEVADGEDAERVAQRRSFEMLKHDPRFLHLQQYLHTRGHRATFESTQDPSTYRIVYIDLWDANWQRLLAHEGTGARLLTAYLERGVAPKRLKVALDIPTGTCTEGEAGWMGWGGLVPLDPRSA